MLHCKRFYWPTVQQLAMILTKVSQISLIYSKSGGWDTWATPPHNVGVATTSLAISAPGGYGRTNDVINIVDSLLVGRELSSVSRAHTNSSSTLGRHVEFYMSRQCDRTSSNNDPMNQSLTPSHTHSHVQSTVIIKHCSLSDTFIVIIIIVLS